MKKWMTLLLAAAMLLGLAACGAGAPEADAPSESGLHFAATTSVYENEYKADDGTLLLSEHYELPRLELRTADGALRLARMQAPGGKPMNDCDYLRGHQLEAGTQIAPEETHAE